MCLGAPISLFKIIWRQTEINKDHNGRHLLTKCPVFWNLMWEGRWSFLRVWHGTDLSSPHVKNRGQRSWLCSHLLVESMHLTFDWGISRAWPKGQRKSFCSLTSFNQLINAPWSIDLDWLVRTIQNQTRAQSLGVVSRTKFRSLCLFWVY